MPKTRVLSLHPFFLLTTTIKRRRRRPTTHRPYNLSPLRPCEHTQHTGSVFWKCLIRRPRSVPEPFFGRRTVSAHRLFSIPQIPAFWISRCLICSESGERYSQAAPPLSCTDNEEREVEAPKQASLISGTCPAFAYDGVLRLAKPVLEVFRRCPNG